MRENILLQIFGQKILRYDMVIVINDRVITLNGEM